MSDPQAEGFSAAISAPPKHQEMMIRDIFPLRQVHLIAGGSGSGKSTWLLRMIDAWRKGEPLFGHASYPMPFIYVSLDRDEEDCYRTFDRIGIDAKTFALYVPDEAADKLSLLMILKGLKKQFPATRVFFVEGFQSKCPDGKQMDYSVTAVYLKELRRFCKQEDVTLIGVCHVAKVKKGEEYRDPRQQVYGSVAWAGYSGTIILITQKDASNANGPRTLMILPRNAKSESYTLVMENGVFTVLDKPKQRATNWYVFLEWWQQQTPGQFVTRKEIEMATGIAHGALDLELKKAFDHELLQRKDRGSYEICEVAAEEVEKLLNPKADILEMRAV